MYNSRLRPFHKVRVKSKFALDILPYLNEFAFFLFFFDISRPIANKLTWRDFSRGYKSQTQANIRRSAWITIPIAMSHASFASLVLFVPRNPRALR